MMYRAMAIAPLLLALAAAACPGEGPGPYLEPGVEAALAAAGELRESLPRGAVPRRIPPVPWRGQILEQVRALEPTVGVEVLLLHEGPAPDTPEARLEFYNLIHAASRMKGLQYYSASRKRMRTLFAESYTVDGPESRRRIPDPLSAGPIPAEDTGYQFQEDLTFGANIYRSDYYYDDGVFAVRLVNLTPMRYFGITMVQPGESLTWIVVAPAGGKLLFYGLGCAHSLNPLGLAKTREDSFYNRLKAFYGWFTGQLAREP